MQKKVKTSSDSTSRRLEVLELFKISGSFVSQKSSKNSAKIGGLVAKISSKKWLIIFEKSFTGSPWTFLLKRTFSTFQNPSCAI